MQAQAQMRMSARSAVRRPFVQHRALRQGVVSVRCSSLKPAEPGKTRLGFAGIGIMGLAMTHNLLKAGESIHLPHAGSCMLVTCPHEQDVFMQAPHQKHNPSLSKCDSPAPGYEVYVWNRNPAKCDPLKAAGAKVCHTRDAKHVAPGLTSMADAHIVNSLLTQLCVVQACSPLLAQTSTHARSTCYTCHEPHLPTCLINDQNALSAHADGTHAHGTPTSSHPHQHASTMTCPFHHHQAGLPAHSPMIEIHSRTSIVPCTHGCA